jgi:hypothetical protein
MIDEEGFRKELTLGTIHCTVELHLLFSCEESVIDGYDGGVGFFVGEWGNGEGFYLELGGGF